MHGVQNRPQWPHDANSGMWGYWARNAFWQSASEQCMHSPTSCLSLQFVSPQTNLVFLSCCRSCYPGMPPDKVSVALFWFSLAYCVAS